MRTKTKPEPFKARQNIRMTFEMKETIKEAAVKLGITEGEFIREAIAEKLEKANG